MRVIGDLVGAPEEDHLRIMAWTNAAVSGTDPEYQGAVGAELEASLSLYRYFAELRLEREVEPRDDLTTVLTRAEVDGQVLSPVRFGIFLMLLASAGNETTRNAMSHGVWAFAQHPEQWQRLREDRQLIPSAVEEVLRWASPVLYFRRNALADTEIGGRPIAAGDLVSLWYVSANRDEEHFEDPFTFDVGRDPNHHVSFGGGGPHFCLGASLARLELRVAFEEMLDRYESIEVVGKVERLRSNFLHGIKHLPVRPAPA
jgi:cholest-4-en-3-one 26-monooxygenase